MFLKGILRRRQFLKAISAVATGASCFSLAKAPPLTDWGQGRYGPLIKDPKGILDLPLGFSYHLFSQTGSKMDDGFRVPSALDGMAAFPGPKGTTVLVRNHELSPNDGRTLPWDDKQVWRGLDPGLVYDRGLDQVHVSGGTTTLVYDTKSQKLLTHYLSLAGTSTNCAGGRTPWQTWISCEETTINSVDGKDNHHGYCFEVDPLAGKLQPPRRLPGLGRFCHEAVAIDPRNGIVYLTEDINVGLFYRFIPEQPNNLAGPGKLQALSILDLPGESTANRPEYSSKKFAIGQKMKVKWLDLDETDNPNNDLMQRGQAKGANTFCRGEGIDYGCGDLVFSCTSAGPAKQGQIWRYTPGENSGQANEKPGTLQLFSEPNDHRIMSMADNLCIAPNCDVILTEDNPKYHPRVLGITPQGKVYPIAKNVRNKHEVAGCTWSADGKTLFFNMFDDGGTLAVIGPW